MVLGHQKHEAVDKKLDVPRLTIQYGRILNVLADLDWHTLQEIAEKTNTPHGSVGSQIRNARVAGYVIDKRRSRPGSGLWEYRFTGQKKERP